MFTIIRNGNSSVALYLAMFINCLLSILLLKIHIPYQSECIFCFQNISGDDMVGPPSSVKTQDYEFRFSNDSGL